jgi:hypothetical protein
MRKARMPRRDKDIWLTLFDRIEWKTAVIPDRFQPRSAAELAQWCGLSQATTLRGLTGLEHHGWVQRNRAFIRGRGHATTYQPTAGRDYPASAARCEPKTGAERTRKWREKLRQIDVTPGPEIRQIDVTEYVSQRHTSPGQAPVPAKRVRDEGEVEEGPSLTACRVCLTPMDPVLPRLGYATHPCCDPDDQGDLHVGAADLLAIAAAA